MVSVVGGAAERHLATYHDDDWTTERGLDPLPHTDRLHTLFTPVAG